MNKLNFEGVESYTTDTYYDIVNGYYTKEIACEVTRKVLQDAIDVIDALVIVLEDKELIG